MKKTFSLMVGCLLLLWLSGTAFSAQGPYVSGNLGFGFLQDSGISEPGFSGEAEFDPGVALGFALGNAFGSYRLEGEFAFQQNDFDRISAFGGSVNANGDMSSTALLVNGYYDFRNGGAVTPYISAGLGLATVEVNDLTIGGAVVGSEDDTVVAYHLGAGLGFAINPRTTIDLKYRYFATEDPDIGGTKFEYSTHNFLFGFRYSF